MREFEPSVGHEFHPDIKYPDGWREILEAPDTEDYRNWLDELSELTKSNISGENIWWENDEIETRWQMAVEVVANAAITPDDLSELSQDQIVEAGLIALKTNIEEGLGWEEEGLKFTVPDMFLSDSPQEASVDLRDFNVARRHII